MVNKLYSGGLCLSIILSLTLCYCDTSEKNSENDANVFSDHNNSTSTSLAGQIIKTIQDKKALQDTLVAMKKTKHILEIEIKKVESKIDSINSIAQDLKQFNKNQTAETLSKTIVYTDNGHLVTNKGKITKRVNLENWSCVKLSLRIAPKNQVLFEQKKFGILFLDETSSNPFSTQSVIISSKVMKKMTMATCRNGKIIASIRPDVNTNTKSLKLFIVWFTEDSLQSEGYYIRTAQPLRLLFEKNKIVKIKNSYQ